MSTTPTPAEVVQAASWLRRNVPNILKWIDLIKKTFSKTPTVAVVILSMLTTGCAAKIGAGVAVVGGIVRIISKLPDVPAPPGPETPRPSPSATATPLPTLTPTPTPTVTVAPTVQPTAIPTNEPTSAPTVAPTPAPCNAAPKAPDTPVSVLFPGRCPRGGEQVNGYDATARFAPPGTVICAAISTCTEDGHGACPGIGDRASWAFGYNLNQGQTIEVWNGVALIYDAGRGCKDYYGRFFHEKQGCSVLYTNPTDPNAQWSYNAIAPAAECTPTPIPTQGTPVPPMGTGCHLPRGTGDGTDCPKTTGHYVNDVSAAISKVIVEHSEIFTQDNNYVIPGKESNYYQYVLNNLYSAGFCAFLDGGNEIALKKQNSFSEQYATLASDGRVRVGANTYRATCTPAWKDIPEGPTQSTECPCLLIFTVKFLGVNDGQPPVLHPGDTATLDVTPRFACHNGDSRGQPCDKTCEGRPVCGGRKCEPAANPVQWITEGPCGNLREFNDGYGVNIKNLQSGTCTVRVTPTIGAYNQEGELIKRCPWSPGSSVPDTITFTVE
jgi:hypothetical protein